LEGPLKRILIAATVDVAAWAERHGIEQVMVDLEVLGKAERQRGIDSHMTSHALEDVSAFARVLNRAELLVRVNPFGPHSRREVEAVLERGAERIMLPMFTTVDEVAELIGFVGERAPLTLLVETPAALARLPILLDVLRPHDLIYFGLNDLTLALGLKFVFEVVAGGLLDGAIALCRQRGVSFGIGGLGRIGGGDLPAEMVLGELLRLGADWVILSRAFHRGARSEAQLQELVTELGMLDAVEARLKAGPPEVLEENRKAFAQRAFALGRQSTPTQRVVA
jgi:hypothetical protein